MVSRSICILSAIILIGSTAASGTLDFYCPDYGKKSGPTTAKCFIEAERQLKALGCEAESSKSTMLSCGGGVAGSTCGILVLKNCGYAGGSTDGKTYDYGGTEADCIEQYGSKASYVQNKSKNPYFPGICLVTSQSRSGTLDVRCAKHRKGMSESECLKEAEAQLGALGCEVDRAARQMKPSCGGSGDPTSCGIFVLKGCGYAGGSSDGKRYDYGGTQADCVEMYGRDAKFIKNSAKDPFFPGICQMSVDGTGPSVDKRHVSH